MADLMQLVYAGIAFGGLYLAYTGGYLDKAGEALVQASAKGGG